MQCISKNFRVGKIGFLLWYLRLEEVGDAVYIKEFPSGKDWVPAVVSSVRGPLSYYVSLSDGRVVRQHVEHIRIRTCDSWSKLLTLTLKYPPWIRLKVLPNESESQADNSQPPRRSGRASHPPDYYHSTV